MKLSDFTIFYLNLKKRPERRIYIENQLERMGLLEQSIYIEAIDGQSLPIKVQEHYLGKIKTMASKRERILGRIGCYLTHLMILHLAVVMEIDNLLIIEDDCLFIDPDLDEIPEPPTDAKMFYLGGLFWKQKPETHKQIKQNSQLNWIPIDRHHLKIACTFCYGVRGRNTISELFGEIQNARPSAIDIMYINFIQKYPNTTYIINPVKCLQENRFESDITFKGGTNKSSPYKNKYFYTVKQEKKALKLLGW